MNRSELKQLIKECIIEVLSEGLRSAISENKKPSSQTLAAKLPATSLQQKQALLEKRHQEELQKKRNVSILEQRILQEKQAQKKALEEAKNSNNIFSQILADTAMNTQLPPEPVTDNSGYSPGQSVSSLNPQFNQNVLAETPQDIFGQDTISIWNKLLFDK